MLLRFLLPVLAFTIACCSDAAGDAESFEISLHSWACLEPCKQFGLSLNEALTSIFVDGSGGDETLAFLAVRRSSDAEVAAQVGLLGASCEGGPSDNR